MTFIKQEKLEEIERHLPDVLRGAEFGEVVKQVAYKNRLDPHYKMSLGAIGGKLIDFTRSIDALELKDWSLDRQKIKDLQVLDIACGSSYQDSTRELSYDQKRMLESWLCRSLSYLDANVVGIDKSYPQYKREKIDGQWQQVGQIEKEWTFIQQDLTVENALHELPDESFDVIVSQRFMLHYLLIEDAPFMQKIRVEEKNRYMKITRNLISQIRRSLKEGGIFLLNQTVFKKQKSDLIQDRHLNHNNPSLLDLNDKLSL